MFLGPTADAFGARQLTPLRCVPCAANVTQHPPTAGAISSARHGTERSEVTVLGSNAVRCWAQRYRIAANLPRGEASGDLRGFVSGKLAASLPLVEGDGGLEPFGGQFGAELID